jgi:type VII secretion-associated protein (TIGR03931 family)
VTESVVVEVGPVTVRGPACAAPDLVVTALECIDDDIAILDEQPVAVAAVWRELFRTVLPERVEAAVLVCPTWWPLPWVDRAREAAATRAAKAVVLQRADLLAVDVPGVPSLVEVAPEFVVVSRAGSVVAAEPRRGEPADVARSVLNSAGTATTVLVDAPVGVVGASELAHAICECFRAHGITATSVHPDRVLAAGQQQTLDVLEVPSRDGKSSRALMLAAVLACVTLICACLGLAAGTDRTDSAAVPMTLLVEGRIALKVPALWAVRRIVSGPGSARVQVSAPDDSAAVLLTQSVVRNGETQSAISATLRGALDEQRAGVFGRFNPDDRRADRPAATYRELRDGRQIDWAVFVDGAVRIAVGCQCAPGAEETVSYACQEAIRSAHAIS